jgi:hypothetical protein
MIAAPWLLALVYLIYNPERLLSHYGFRDFTVIERVLTEFRIVIDYFRLIVLPNVGDMGLYHDDIIVSTSLFHPVSTLLSLLLIVGLLVSAFYAKAKYPLFSLGILWFFGGHILESTVYPLDLMFLHRNYLPSIGIFLALAELAIAVYRLRRKFVLVVVMSLFLMFSLCTRSLAHHWSGDP